MPEVVRLRQGGAHLGEAGQLAGERAEALEFGHDDVDVPAHLLQAAASREQWLPRTNARWRSYTCGGTTRLTRPCSSSSSMKTMPFAVIGRWRAIAIPATVSSQRSARFGSSTVATVSAAGGTQELERMDADREPRPAVVGEHLLPGGLLGQRRRFRRRLQRQRELARAATRGLLAGHEAELPEQHAPRLVEAVAGARLDERLEDIAVDRRPLDEVAEMSYGRPAAIASASASPLPARSRRRCAPRRPRPSTTRRSRSRPAAPSPRAAARRGRGSPAGRSPSAGR